MRVCRDDGFASLVVVAGAAVLLLALAAGAVLADLHATGSRARAAADLAALAAARDAPGGTDSACAQAAEVAQANRARIESCAIGGSFDVDVVAAAPPGALLARVAALLGLPEPVVRARAVAGPAR